MVDSLVMATTQVSDVEEGGGGFPHQGVILAFTDKTCLFTVLPVFLFRVWMAVFHEKTVQVLRGRV